MNGPKYWVPTRVVALFASGVSVGIETLCTSRPRRVSCNTHTLGVLSHICSSVGDKAHMLLKPKCGR